MNNNYSRRKFMKTVVVSAGAVGAGSLAGCGSDSSSSSSQPSVPLTTPDGFDTNGTEFPQSVASGDPRYNSIILWTRVNGGGTTHEVILQVSLDADFSSGILESTVSADASNDYCVKIKVTDLEPYTRYYYRFVFDGTASNSGRFRTAPLGSANVNVKYGFVSCQDFSNGYYNSLLKFLESDNDDIDFIVHLGDYIYETTGDSFQGVTRTVSFSDDTGAIDTGESLAASTVSQYRDLYKIYRGDKALQKVHERFPFICIWDDHEFSDDSWQDRGTFFDGMVDEQNTNRKRNAEQAFFEYQPIDVQPTTGSPLDDGQIEVDSATLFPSNIYRTIRFGSNLNLFMTDYRTFRPDHLIPEDGYPGSVIMDELATAQTLYSIPGDTFGFKAGVDLTLNTLTAGAITAVADILNPNATEQQVLRGAVRQAVSGGSLPLLPYVDIDSVTNAELGAFLTALNGALTTINGSIPTVLPFSASPTPTLKELLIYALTAAYQDEDTVSVPLSAAEAQAKAIGIIDGNLDLRSINGTLENLYNTFLTIVNAVGGGLGLPVPFTDYDTMFASLAVALGQPNLVASLGTSQKFLPDFTSDDTNPVGGLDNSGGNPALTDAEAEGIALAGLDNNGNGSFADVGDIPPDTTWGFQGFGVSYALLGKSNISGFIGSRYLVVKTTYDLLNLYHGLVLQTENFGNMWGTAQQTSVFLGLELSTTTWNVIGSSVSFTSLILDASTGGVLDTALTAVGVSAEAFPRTSYLMNVDHWDGYPLTRATYMNDASGNLAASNLGTFQDYNVVIISGDIHAALITDHGANSDEEEEIDGRCLEFTVPGVSSGSFGSFTADSISNILNIAADSPQVVGLVDQLGPFLQAGAPANTTAPQTLNFADPNANGVGIMELSSNQLTCSLYLLDTTSSDGDTALITDKAYAGSSSDEDFTEDANSFASNFTVVTRTSTKEASGANGELVDPDA